MAKFKSPFPIGERVIIDEDPSLVATVTAFQFRASHDGIAELSWLQGGTVQVAWIEFFRITVAP